MATLLKLYLAKILLILPYVVCVYGRYAVDVFVFSLDSSSGWFHGSYLLMAVTVLFKDMGEECAFRC